MAATEFKPIQPYFVLSTDSHYLKRNVGFGGIAHAYDFKMDRKFDYNFAVPDGCVDILFCLSEDYPEVWAHGSTQKPSQTEFREGCEYFGVRYGLGFTPRFLDMPPGELVGQGVALADVYADTQPLMEQMMACNGFADRLDLILNTQAFLSREQTPDVCNILAQQMILHRGTIRVADLTDYTRYSARSINTIFTQYYGLTPKAFCLMLRYQTALQEMTKHRHLSLTDLAQELGYADQSHFLSEFKRYNVLGPKKFMRAVDTHQYQGHIVLS